MPGLTLRLTLAVALVLVSIGAGTTSGSTPKRDLVAFTSGAKHPDVYVIASDGTGRRRLTKTTADEYCPAWSPDGDRLSFTVEQGKRDWVQVSDARGRRLWKIPGVSCGRWSPDGSKLLLARENGVYLADAASGATQQLPIPIDSIGSWPVWSPDGTEIAYAAAASDDNDAERSRRLTLVVATADGAQTRDVPIQAPDWCTAGCRIYARFFVWAPGADIAFVLVGGDDYPERLYAIREDGTDQHLLSGKLDDVYWPIWSPDGSRIAFTFRGGGHLDQQWVADTRGGGVRLLSSVVSRTSNLSGCFNGSWSSDGTRLACWGHAGGLYVVDTVSGSSRLLTKSASIDYDSAPSWAPMP